jgi:hypothetical protein
MTPWLQLAISIMQQLCKSELSDTEIQSLLEELLRAFVDARSSPGRNSDPGG